jgi:hypothetical protein
MMKDLLDYLYQYRNESEFLLLVMVGGIIFMIFLSVLEAIYRALKRRFKK